MAKDILLEIGLEEVPARFMRGAVEQLADKMGKWLTEARIAYGEINVYATPRRLALVVRQVADKQQDIREESKGPAKKIALDEQGNWTKAAIGFARGQGVQPEDLYVKELNGVEYVYATKSSVGSQTVEVLPDGLQTLIGGLHFPKNMRWGAYEFRFVRPIRWLVALYGEEVIDLEITGVRAGRTTHGHRFLGQEAILHDAGEYVETLRREQVIVDIEERKAMIVQQIEHIAAKNGWKVPMKEDLLEEVVFLVEYPTALTGSFDERFLQIPQEVLITSMREHQRYFPVLGADDKLLPHFITVRNGNDVSLDQVARGNEKVLRARLSDAKFFYEEDQKLPIAAAMSKLEQVVFHEELGTIGDKVRRLRKVAEVLAKTCKASNEELSTVQRAAAICKFDLVTQMVYEFPELQGVMGMDYARKAGETEEVAVAINEHYQPRYSGDQSPKTLPGAIVSIADKIDTIVGCFSIGITPTGSQDPYALRRQAQGIVQMILDLELPITLDQLFEIALHVYREADAQLLKRDDHEIKQELAEFFGLRVKHVLQDFARYDVVDAIMASGFMNVASTVRRCRALTDAVQGSASAAYKPIVDSYTRVMNLAAKAEAEVQMNVSLFEQTAEHELYKVWQHVHDQYDMNMQHGQEKQALEQLSELSKPITAYFEAVMVMAEDERVRNNRLSLLSLIAADLQRFADFNKLVW